MQDIPESPQASQSPHVDIGGRYLTLSRLSAGICVYDVCIFYFWFIMLANFEFLVRWHPLLLK